jgi:hypothetical protein
VLPVLRGSVRAEQKIINPRSFFIDSRGEQMVDYGIRPLAEVCPEPSIFDNRSC